MNDEHRTWFGRFCRYFLGPVFYWLDMEGDERRPSHGKVLSSFVIFALTPVAVGWGSAIAVGVMFEKSPGVASVTGFLILVTMLLAASFGNDTFKAALKAKFGGLAGALERSADREPELIRAQAEIQDRRKDGQAQGVEASP